LPENHSDVFGLYGTYGLILVNGLAFVLLEDSKYQAKVTNTVIPQGEGAAPYMSEPTIGHNPKPVWSTSHLYNLSPAFHPNTVSRFFSRPSIFLARNLYGFLVSHLAACASQEPCKSFFFPPNVFA
jgi:hypothetical protein